MAAHRTLPRPFPWTCPSCGKDAVQPAVIRYQARVKHDGTTHEFAVPRFEVPRCGSCGELIITDEADRQLDIALRKHLGLLSPEDILQNRKALGLTQQDVASRTRIAKETICRWETGALVQSGAMDTLLRAFFGCPDLQQTLAEPRRRAELGVPVRSARRGSEGRTRDGGNVIKARAWNDGGSTYGIRVGVANREEFFDRSWTEIEVEIDGQFHRFALTPGFWRRCPEFRDRSRPLIREWLRRHRTLKWAHRNPPQVELLALGDGRFRLLG